MDDFDSSSHWKNDRNITIFNGNVSSYQSLQNLKWFSKTSVSFTVLPNDIHPNGETTHWPSETRRDLSKSGRTHKWKRIGKAEQRHSPWEKSVCILTGSDKSTFIYWKCYRFWKVLEWVYSAILTSMADTKMIYDIRDKERRKFCVIWPRHLGIRQGRIAQIWESLFQTWCRRDLTLAFLVGIGL